MIVLTEFGRPFPDARRASIMTVTQAEGRGGSICCTDGWQAHATLRRRGDPVVIRKPQAASRKPQAASRKRQAASRKP